MWLCVILGSEAKKKSYSHDLLGDDGANQIWVVLKHICLPLWNQGNFAEWMSQKSAKFSLKETCLIQNLLHIHNWMKYTALWNLGLTLSAWEKPSSVHSQNAAAPAQRLRIVCCNS